MEKVTELAAVIRSIESDVALKEDELRNAKNRLERLKTNHKVKTYKICENIESFIELFNSKNQCSHMPEFTYTGDVFNVQTRTMTRHGVYVVYVQLNPDVYLSEGQMVFLRLYIAKVDQYPVLRYSYRFLFSFDT